MRIRLEKTQQVVRTFGAPNTGGHEELDHVRPPSTPKSQTFGTPKRTWVHPEIEQISSTLGTPNGGWRAVLIRLEANPVARVFGTPNVVRPAVLPRHVHGDDGKPAPIRRDLSSRRLLNVRHAERCKNFASESARRARSRPNLRHAEGSALPMRVRLEKTQQAAGRSARRTPDGHEELDPRSPTFNSEVADLLHAEVRPQFWCSTHLQRDHGRLAHLSRPPPKTFGTPKVNTCCRLELSSPDETFGTPKVGRHAVSLCPEANAVVRVFGTPNVAHPAVLPRHVHGEDGGLAPFVAT